MRAEILLEEFTHERLFGHYQMSLWEGRLVLAEADSEVLPEEIRRELARNLEQNGVSLSGFREGRVMVDERERTREMAEKKGTLSAQADFLRAALGEKRFGEFVVDGVMKVVDMPGGGVYKDSDREAGVVEPSGTDMAEFLTNYLEIQMKRENGFLYAPGKQSKGVGWKKKLIYRVEAVTSLTYGVLHTLSFEDEIDAVEYQRGEYFEKFVRQRLIRGWLAADKKVNDDFHKRSVERLEKLINSEKIIRSTPPGTLETVLGLLVKK